MLVPLFLLVIGVVALALLVRQHADTLRAMLQSIRTGRRQPVEPVTVIQDGETIQVNPPPSKTTPPLARLPRLKFQRPSYSAVALTVLALVIVGLAVAIPNSLFVPRSQFVVLVAPFSEGDGQMSAAGRQLARDLVATLNAEAAGVYRAVAIDEIPASPAEGAARLERERADALIYGTSLAGGMLDQESLTPLLIYQPSGSYVPLSWDGYSGRFAMPRTYALSAGPINGRAVLPQLIRSLARYGRGEVDGTFDDLGTLMSDYPMLAQPLPRALRGNIMWAAGNYAAAADEYGRTGVLAVTGGQASEMALLANNLGAIQQDGGNPQLAEQAFAQAETLLGGQTLPELQVNRAHDLLDRRKFAEAITLLEPLRTAEMNVPTALVLVDAYLGGQRYSDAAQQLTQSRRQISVQADRVPAPYADLVQQRLETAASEREVRLGLGTAIGASDQLIWELISGQALSRKELEGPQRTLKDLNNQSNQLESTWQRLSASADVDRKPYSAQIATNQARVTNAAERDRRKLLAAIELDLLRENSAERGILDTVVSSFGGQSVRTAPVEDDLNAILEAKPNDLEAIVLLGFTQIVGGNDEQARQTFERANNTAANRPEPAYGLAQVALPEDRGQAKAHLNDALARDASFYPARTQLATLSEEDGEWQVAIDQRRWLAANRGSDQDTLALAQALKNSGPGGYPEAEQTLLPLANANNAAALVQLSELYLAAGDIAAAETALERASAASPRDPQIAYERGAALQKLGRTAEAQAQYEQAISLDSDNAPARVALGEIYAARGQFDQAASQYEVALRSGTENPATLQEIGRVMLIAGEEQRAVDAYRRAAELADQDPEPQLGLARAYLQIQQPSDAVKAAEAAIQLSGGTNAQARVALGDASLQLGDAAGALGHFVVAEQEDPNLAAAKLGRGRAAAANGEWAVAQGYFQQAIAMDAQSAEARFWNGEALFQQNSIDQAKNEFLAALSLRPNYPEAHYGVAKAQAATGDLAAARESIKAALALRKNYAAAFVLDGVILEQQGDRRAARDAYDKAIAADSRSAEAHYRRGLLDIADGNSAAARRELEAAIRYRDNFPEAHYWLGRAYLGEGEAAKANEQFELALQFTNRDYPEAQYYQGVAREQMGDMANAYSAYRAAIEQAADSAWAREAQAALSRLGQ